MRPALTFLLLTILLAMAAACSDRGPEHEEDEDHGSAVDAHTVAVTRWTDRSELFMEYPVFIAGESGRAAIHVTDLSDFSPLSDGEVVVTLRAPDGRVLEFRDGPSRPGIFGVDLNVELAGKYALSVSVDAPELEDVHDLGTVTVYARGAALPHGPHADEAISFLKEQQWTLEFGTAAAAEREIRSGIDVPATVRPRSGGEAMLAAMVAGRIDPASAVPVPGTRVRSGEALARIVPGSDDLGDAAGLRLALVEAEQSHGLAVSDRDRTQRLVEARALPQRRLDEAQAALAASEARLDAARVRRRRFESLSQSTQENSAAGTFVVRAPFDGVISEVRFSAGVSVEANEPLMRIVDPERVHIVGAIPEGLATTLGEATSAELALDGQIPFGLGEPLNVSPVIDPIARTFEVRFALDNRNARLRVGQAVGLRLFVGAARSVTAIPQSAVVDDGGRPVVFVQTAGESFERRPVRVGDASEGYVHVVTGVEPGERVVHRGAYLVRLAATSTQLPSHGHVH